MKFWKNLLKERTSILFVGCAIAVLSVVAAMIYAFGFGANNPQYFNAAAVALPIVGFVAYVVLVLFKPTANYAAVVLWVCTFAAFLVYAVASYMHLAEVFYSGINPETLKLLDKGFVVCMAMYLVAAIAANVVMWLKVVRKEVVA